MTNDEIEELTTDALRQIAPDIDPDDIDRSADLREEFDIDSMDFLNLITRLSKACSMSIPESDYPQLSSLDALVDYLKHSASG